MKTSSIKIRLTLLLFLLALWGGASLALAQEKSYPADEIFVGAMYLRSPSGSNAYGVNGSVTEYPYEKHSWVGGMLDANELHQNAQIKLLSLTIHEQVSTFMVGPSLVFRMRPSINPFAHALMGAGIVNLHTTGKDTTIYLPSTTTDFAFALGGGLNYPFSRRLAIRGQADYFHISNTGNTNDVKLSIGTVFKF